MVSILVAARWLNSVQESPYAKWAWLQAWHIRDEIYALALAELVNVITINKQTTDYWALGMTYVTTPHT